jgi:DNA-binding MarR family transcriptional regulator
MTTRVLTETEATTWAVFQRMRTRLAGQISRELARQTGLSEADFEILVALIESPDESARSLALRCGLEWEKSRLSHQLRRMEQRGLVTRELCTEDNRSSVIRITEAGRDLVCNARNLYDQAVRRYVIDVLSPDQLRSLAEISEALLAGLDDTRAIQYPTPGSGTSPARS